MQYSTERSWTAVLSGPKECHRGEQLGLILVMSNHDPSKAFVLVTVKSSPLYKFVQVGRDGVISSYNATLTSGERQLLVYIASGKQKRIDIPIVPQVERGPVTVTVVTSTQAGYAVTSHTIVVIPEGSEVRRHTSRLIDLRNRAFEQMYIDVAIEENPIVPYEEWRRFVFGSPEATVSVTGSLLGPLFPDGLSTKECLERDPSKGTDVTVLEFAVNIWSLHYKRFTSQEERKDIKMTLELCNQLYATLLSRMDYDGGFFNWDHSPSSVWITAEVLRALRPAIYADWENILYIDIAVLDKVSQWLVNHQTEEGAFAEKNMSINEPPCSTVTYNVTVPLMTCEVLIGLAEVVSLLTTGVRNIVTNAISKAALYLEHTLNTNSCLLRDARHVAAIAYALHVSKGVVPDKLLLALEQLKTTDKDGFTYWSGQSIISAPVRLEHNRPILGARLYSSGLSQAVYATSYALLVVLAKSPFSPTNDLIVAWLSSIRMNLNGFISVKDTIVAYQALTEYANRVRLLDLTKMEVSMTSSSDSSFKTSFLVDKNTSSIYTRKLERPWGIVEVRSQGRGLSLFQMVSSYRVDRQELTDQSDKTTFGLKILQYYSTARNISAITIEVCTQWLGASQSSGSATLEIDTPTGYFTTESRMAYVVRTTKHPTLCDATVSSRTAVFYFTHIEPDSACFNYTLRRLYPVANMTLYRKAIIYENNRRENFAEVVLESMPLYILSICEVCGSYQCPYCPHYNRASFLCNYNVILITTVFAYYTAKDINLITFG